MLEYELLDKSNYMAYYQIVQSRWGNLLLPYSMIVSYEVLLFLMVIL